MRRKAHQLVQTRSFEYFLAILIVATTVLRGLATSNYLADRLGVRVARVWVLTGAVPVLKLCSRCSRHRRGAIGIFAMLGTSSFSCLSVRHSSAPTSRYSSLRYAC